jgi:2-dehydropantoate 2-reductase
VRALKFSPREARVPGEVGFEVEATASIQNEIWYKLWGNMTINPISALTGATTDLILGDELVEAFCTEVMREASIVGVPSQRILTTVSM